MMKRAPIFIVLGAIIVVVLWFLLIFSPKGDDLSTAKQERDAAQNQEQILKTQLKQLQSLQAERPALDAEKLRLASAVPPNADLAGFILSANQIATASGIDWLSIAPSPPAAGATPNSPSVIALGIQVQGGFFQVLDYLNRLEALPRLVVVDAISISSGGSGTSTSGGTTSSSATTLSVTLTGRAFTSAAPASSGTGGSTPSGSTTTTAPPTTTTKKSGGSQISAGVSHG